MEHLVKLKIWITILILFIASVVYAAAVREAVQALNDLTLPIIFNGVAPSVIIGYFIKKHMDKNETEHTELIGAKNSHEKRITEVETHIEDCPNCPGGRGGSQLEWEGRNGGE